MHDRLFKKLFVLLIVSAVTVFSSGCAWSAEPIDLDVYIRFRVKSPQLNNMTAVISGFRHEGDPWRFPALELKAATTEWSPWANLTSWSWHGKIDRSGGVAEYPSLTIYLKYPPGILNLKGSEFEVQLADAPSEEGVVISFSEKSESSQIVFLAPFPLRKNIKDFETGRQMSARHARWAKEAAGNDPIRLKRFEIISNLWSQYDPFVVNQEIGTLKSLGFNVIGDIAAETAQDHAVKIMGKTWLYHPDPQTVTAEWEKFVRGQLNREAQNPSAVSRFDLMAYYEISDEISALDLNAADKSDLDKWFRAYLRSQKLADGLFDLPIEKIEYPLRELFMDALPSDIPLKERRLLYHAAKFGHWWSAKQLRHTSDAIKKTFPGMQTGTLLPSHGFLGTAWGPTKIGMTYRMLDMFELGQQQSTNQLSSEDWLGLNRMYGPKYTWTGGQTFGYLNALLRSAIADKPILMRTFITPSDDHYLRLKAHSAIGQGVKSIFFWSYGPTAVSTENYWSDLKSEYQGIAKLNRSLEKTEDVLYPAKTATDPVAILYSVSHDIWNNDKQAIFTERRLLWHALRHLQIQPNFLREEDLTRGKLKNYKVLYVSDWNISRSASDKIDSWVKDGGILYLSAGAATRDEYNEPYVPTFAKFVWRDIPRYRFVHQNSTYNERTDLQTLVPLTGVNIRLGNRGFDLPVLGVRTELNDLFETFAEFEDGKPAGKIVPYGLGKIIAVGFLPMLAYGRLAEFKPATLAEKWKPEAREIIGRPLEYGRISPVAKADVPLVEVNLLESAGGAAVVLANYTYQPIASLNIEIRTGKKFESAFSVNGSPVRIISQSNGILRLRLPLDETDIIVLQ